MEPCDGTCRGVACAGVECRATEILGPMDHGRCDTNANVNGGRTRDAHCHLGLLLDWSGLDWIGVPRRGSGCNYTAVTIGVQRSAVRCIAVRRQCVSA